MPVRRAAALALGSALLLTACGGGDTATTELDAGSAPPAATASAASSPSSAEVRSADELFRAIAAAQEQAQTSRFTTTSSAAGVEVSGSGAVRIGPDPAVDVTMALPADAGLPGGGEVQMLLVGGELFFRLPGAEAEIGAPWVKASPDGTDPLSQALAPAFDSLQQAAAPDFTIYQAATLAPRGEQQVDGVATTAYDFTVDVAAAAAAAAGAQQEQLQQLADSGATTLTGTVWVDGDDLVRTYATDVTVAGTTATSTVTFSGYGEPVEIAAPPADQVVDASLFQ